MLFQTDHGEDIFINTFTTAVRVPSGHAGINFGTKTDFNLDTVILNISFDQFISEWNRT